MMMIMELYMAGITIFQIILEFHLIHKFNNYVKTVQCWAKLSFNFYFFII